MKHIDCLRWIASFARKTILVWIVITLLAACAAPTPSGGVSGFPNPTKALAANSQKEPDAKPTTFIKITAQSGGQTSKVTVVPLKSATPAPVLKISPTAASAPKNAQPIIFTGGQFKIDQKCGHGEVVASDGHTLYATPQLIKGKPNFLEKEPIGTRVDILDCRVWIDDQNISWLAVRTAQKKLGWMFLQPDMFLVTIYPLVATPPRASTGLPVGAMVAYVPPSNCEPESTSGLSVATSIGIDFIPVVGDIKGVGEAVTGCDLVTGESLGNWRWLGLLGLVGLAEIAVLSHADEAVDGARAARNITESLSYGDEAVMAALRNSDNYADFLKDAQKLEKISGAELDALRNLEDGGKLSDDVVRVLSKVEQPCSFAGSTPVTTPSGTVAIDQIKPGDLVLAYDESLGQQGYYPVTATSAHVDPVLVSLVIGSETILTTPDHPFYVAGHWVAAQNLHAGDRVFSAAGKLDPIQSITILAKSQTMFNLTVDRAHTYFVGLEEWLVHNSCRAALRNNLKSSLDLPDWAKNDEVEWQAHHVIPVEFEDYDIIKKAKDGDWDFNGASNGIPLPNSAQGAEELGLPYHIGSHPDYSGNVDSELRKLENDAIREGWDNHQIAAAMERLAESFRADIMKQMGRIH